MRRLLDSTRRHDLSFWRNGTIRISSRVARALSIAPGDSVNIAVHNSEYFLFAVRHSLGRHHAQCFPTKKGSANFRASSVSLCRSLLDALSIFAPGASFMAGEPQTISDTTYLPIITARPALHSGVI